MKKNTKINLDTYNRTAEELERFSKDADKGFELVAGDVNDKQGRSAVNWQYVALRM